MPLVTISAPYGAGGGVIAPEVAERLGVPFLDRAIAGEVANRLDMSVAEVLEREDTVGTSHGIGKLLAGMASLGAIVGAASPDPGAEGEEADEETFQREAERAVRELTETGDGVILGRAAALMLADRAGALHVRLDGPRRSAPRTSHAQRGSSSRRPSGAGGPTTTPGRPTCATSTASIRPT